MVAVNDDESFCASSAQVGRIDGLDPFQQLGLP
jgi:hypothetical protein